MSRYRITLIAQVRDEDLAFEAAAPTQRRKLNPRVDFWNIWDLLEVMQAGNGSLAEFAVDRVERLQDGLPTIRRLTRADVAAMAGTSVGMVDTWRHRHADFPKSTSEPGQHLRWDADEITAWLAKPRRTGRPRKGV